MDTSLSNMVPADFHAYIYHPLPDSVLSNLLYFPSDAQDIGSQPLDLREMPAVLHLVSFLPERDKSFFFFFFIKLWIRM